MTAVLARVLVVDDDDVDREKFRRLAERGGLALEIDEASSGASALRLLAGQRFDVIVVDYRLGDTTGIELVRAIRQQEHRPLPIIMLTGLGDERVAVSAIREGVYEYLTKANLTVAEVVQTVSSALRSVGLERRLAEANAARDLAEQKLSQSRQQFEDAQQLALLGSIEINVETGEQSWSHEIYRLLGDEPGSYVPSQDRLLRRVHADDLDGIERAAADLGSKAQAFRREFRLVWEDATVRHVLAHGRVTHGAPGTPHKLVVLIQDVTALRTAERVASEREAQIQGLFEASSMGILITSMDGSVLRVNPALCRLSGYSAGELASMSVTDLLSGEDGAASGSDTFEFDGTKDVQGAEQLLTHKDGSSVWVSVNMSPVRGPAIAVSAVAVLIQDIRDRRHAETLLRAGERRFRNLVNGAPIGIFENDASGQCIFVNETWTQITGWSAREALVANGISWLQPQDRAPSEECPQAAFEERPSASEFRFLRPDGRATWVTCNVRPTLDDTGTITGYLGTIMDITDQKLQQASLIAAKETAEEAVRAKADFLARISHEIRTPMNSVIGMTALTLQGHLGAEQREFLEMANSAAKSLLRLIDDLLDFSRAEAGGLSLERVPFDLRQCVTGTLRPMQHRAAEKGLELVLAMSDDVPRFVIGDAHRLSQVLSNLVSNAIKFTDAGEVVVRVDADDAGKQLCRLHFAISDTGIGVPEDKQAMIFEAFGQADESVSRRFGGTGLGLAICAQIVKLMHGGLWLESQLGQGSTFQFSIEWPVVSDEGFAAGVIPVGGAERPGEIFLAKAPRRILVAEDNYMNQRLIQALLGDAGHHVTIVGDGGAALNRLAVEDFDLVLMDVQMPGMSGIEAVRRLRAREAGGTRRVPVVALTAQAMHGDAERCLEAGMDGYVAKPFDLVELEWAMVRTPSGGAAAKPSVVESDAPYDQAALQRRLGADPALLVELGRLFSPRAAALLTQIQSSIEARESAGVKRAAHELKGMLLNLTAGAATRIVRELEAAGQTAQYEDAAAHLAQLVDEVARLASALAGRSSTPSVAPPTRG